MVDKSAFTNILGEAAWSCSVQAGRILYSIHLQSLHGDASLKVQSSLLPQGEAVE